MKILSNSELLFFNELLNSSPKKLKNFMFQILKKYYDEEKIKFDNNFIVAEGDIPIMLICHTDTVFDYDRKDLFYDKEKNVLWSPQGAGFDDRAGAFIIINVLKNKLKPWILLCDNEETTGSGAAFASISLKDMNKKIKYMIELDRRGEKDCVFYHNGNEKMIEYIESFGFVKNQGTYSDISQLGPSFEVGSVNLSVGYVDEHSYVERLYVDHMWNTLKRVIQMLKDDSAPFFEHVESYVFQPSVNIGKLKQCNICRVWHKEDLLIQTKENIYVCPKCVDNHVSWCQVCELPFLTNTRQVVCHDCKEKIKV